MTAGVAPSRDGLSAQLKAAALERGDFEDFVFLHGGSERLPALRRIVPLLGGDDERYWRLLRMVWEVEGVPGVRWREWLPLLTSARGKREHMMTDHERLSLRGFPDPLTVWRGTAREDDAGWSWTADRNVADHYAWRGAMTMLSAPIVLEGLVHPSDVIAYLSRQAEIIVPYAGVRVTSRRVGVLARPGQEGAQRASACALGSPAPTEA